MNLEMVVLISELMASIAVVLTLVYLARGTRVNKAASRHSLSEFAMELTKFRAEHADRWAKVMQEETLSPGDVEFRKWNHMMLLLHAETYFRHYELGLMPDNHWNNYAKFVIAALDSPGFEAYREEVGFAFSGDFSEWMNEIISESRALKSGSK